MTDDELNKQGSVLLACVRAEGLITGGQAAFHYDPNRFLIWMDGITDTDGVLHLFVEPILVRVDDAEPIQKIPPDRHLLH